MHSKCHGSSREWTQMQDTGATRTEELSLFMLKCRQSKAGRTNQKNRTMQNKMEQSRTKQNRGSNKTELKTRTKIQTELMKQQGTGGNTQGQAGS